MEPEANEDLHSNDRKVWRPTLDVSLIENMTFIETMGNERSGWNAKATLPPSSERSGIEDFIRAEYVRLRYQDKIWSSKDRKPARSCTTPDSPKQTRPVRLYNGEPKEIDLYIYSFIIIFASIFCICGLLFLWKFGGPEDAPAPSFPDVPT